MISIRGTYENGVIKLLDPTEIKGDTNVVITFLDETFPFPEGPSTMNLEVKQETIKSQDNDVDDQPDEFFEKLRKHKRYKARGNITIVEGEDERIYPLNDYSAGGLSFFSDRLFQVGEKIMAALKYNASGELLVMNFEIIVRGIFEEERDQYKVGCQFGDDVDEELWHTIMGQ